MEKSTLWFLMPFGRIRKLTFDRIWKAVEKNTALSLKSGTLRAASSIKTCGLPPISCRSTKTACCTGKISSGTENLPYARETGPIQTKRKQPDFGRRLKTSGWNGTFYRKAPEFFTETDESYTSLYEKIQADFPLGRCVRFFRRLPAATINGWNGCLPAEPT